MKGADVVVVGGAVGGTSTAPLLAELGTSVILQERVTEPAAVGAPGSCSSPMASPSSAATPASDAREQGGASADGPP
jgi:glycine/D-amino acid oxidase-like deaminating enzyme